jgi:hypothetical protein
MNPLFPRVLILLCGAAAGPLAWADEPATTSPASALPDKSFFTLLNPTPDAQLRDMDTDRPNFTNTPHTIDAGHFQVEIGIMDYAYDRDNSSEGDLRSYDVGFGQFNLRIGVLNELELNMAIDAFETDRTTITSSEATSRASGFGDTTIGVKLNLWGNEGGDSAGYTALAIQPQFKLPTARSGVGNGKFEFSLAAPFLANLPAGFHLGLQPGVSYERNSGNNGYVAGFPGSISVDRVLFGGLDVYLEYFVDATTERHLAAPQTVDIGGTYPLSKNIVLDAGINLGVNRASKNVEVLTGISIRR